MLKIELNKNTMEFTIERTCISLYNDISYVTIVKV